MLPFELRVLVYIATSLCLLATGLVLATLEDERSSLFWLTGGVLSAALVYVYEMVAGLTGLLTSGSLVALTAGGFAVSMVGARKSGRRPIHRIQTELSHLRTLAESLPGSPFALGITIVSLALATWLTAVGLLLPPVGWDSLVYHLPPIVEWIHLGEIHWVTNTHPYYPRNGELFTLWHAILPRSQTFLNTTQLYFALLGSIAVYATGRELGLQRVNALLAGVFFLASPIVVAQAITTYVDLTFAALFISSVAFLVVLARTGSTRHLVLLGITTGLMLGVKTSGVAAAGLIGVAYLAIRMTNDRTIQPQTVRRTALLGGLIGLFGGYWYLRTWYHVGNPVYPLAIDVFGTTIFEGPLSTARLQSGPWTGTFAESLHGSYDRTTFASRLYLSWFEKTPIYGKGTAIGGFGPLWAILGVPGILLFGGYALVNRNSRALVVIAIPTVLLVTTASYFPRYTIFVLLVGGIGAGFARERVTVRSRTMLSVLFVVLLLTSVGLSSAFNPWKYGDYVDRSLSNSEDRTSMVVRPERSPLSHDTYTELIEDGSNIGFVPRGPVAYGVDPIYDDFTFNLYDDEFRNRVVYLGDTTTRDEFRSRVERADLDYVLVYETRRHTEFVDTSMTLRLRNEHWYVYEVTP